MRKTVWSVLMVAAFATAARAQENGGGAPQAPAPAAAQAAAVPAEIPKSYTVTLGVDFPTAYLFRGILFGGDAVNWRPGSGFQGARAEFSDSVAQNRESLRSLWQRLAVGEVRVMCTAHGKCALADSALRQRVLR